jgi:hypothetical protein
MKCGSVVNSSEEEKPALSEPESFVPAASAHAGPDANIQTNNTRISNYPFFLI